MARQKRRKRATRHVAQPQPTLQQNLWPMILLHIVWANMFLSVALLGFASDVYEVYKSRDIKVLVYVLFAVLLQFVIIRLHKRIPIQFVEEYPNLKELAVLARYAKWLIAVTTVNVIYCALPLLYKFGFLTWLWAKLSYLLPGIPKLGSLGSYGIGGIIISLIVSIVANFTTELIKVIAKSAQQRRVKPKR